jgi:hypothetical protein
MQLQHPMRQLESRQARQDREEERGARVPYPSVCTPWAFKGLFEVGLRVRQQASTPR